MTPDAGDGGEKEEKKPKFNVGPGNVYAFFGFLTALFGFIFLVDPALRPDPRQDQVASLSVSALDEGITFKGYAVRFGPRADELVRKVKNRGCLPGNVVYLDEQLQGFKHRDVTVKFLTMDANTHRRVFVGEDDKAISGGTASKDTGQVTTDEGVSMQWVQWPPTDGRYFVRFEAFSGGNLLALVDTKPFKVTTARANTLTARCIEEKLLHQSADGPGFDEASFGGGGGVDWGQVLLYAGLGILGLLLGALLYHGVAVLRQRRQE